MANVYLIKAQRSESAESLTAKLQKLWQHAGFNSVFEKHELTALKLHVGEPGTVTFTPPAIVAPLVQSIKACGAYPFLTDTSVLYKSPRDNAVGHFKIAHKHGFGYEATGAPFISADGLIGADEIEVTVSGKHFEEVAIATGIMQARSMLVLTHATGHLGTGYGGALKNLGMGCCSRKSKLRQHHGQQPHIDVNACTACGTCATWCPNDAIDVDDHATINDDKCIGCGECIAVCRDAAVEFDWGIMGLELQERIVEHAAAIIRSKPGKLAYITVAMGITKDCDCLGLNQQPLLEDIGFIAGDDAVAIDQAVLDLVQAQAGRTLESMSYPRIDAREQIRYAEAMGLGSSLYQLHEIS